MWAKIKHSFESLKKKSWVTNCLITQIPADQEQCLITSVEQEIKLLWNESKHPHFKKSQTFDALPPAEEESKALDTGRIQFKVLTTLPLKFKGF